MKRTANSFEIPAGVTVFDRAGRRMATGRKVTEAYYREHVQPQVQREKRRERDRARRERNTVPVPNALRGKLRDASGRRIPFKRERVPHDVADLTYNANLMRVEGAYDAHGFAPGLPWSRLHLDGRRYSWHVVLAVYGGVSNALRKRMGSNPKVIHSVTEEEPVEDEDAGTGEPDDVIYPWAGNFDVQDMGEDLEGQFDRVLTIAQTEFPEAEFEILGIAAREIPGFRGGQ